MSSATAIPSTPFSRNRRAAAASTLARLAAASSLLMRMAAPLCCCAVDNDDVYHHCSMIVIIILRPTYTRARPRCKRKAMLASFLAPRLARLNIHYGWVIVAVTFLTMLSTAGAMGLPGALILPLDNEFGWGVSAISSALALRLALFGLMGP